LSDGWEPRMRRQTRQLVRKHRSAIERVAHALIDKQTLAGTRLDRLVGVARGEMK
jgi:ATP-dependent Zn protease